MSVDASIVKALRQKTSAGVMQCKNALLEAHGDLEAAEEIIRKQGAMAAQKKSARESVEGMVVSRLSVDGKFGVLVEVNCETDFVAMSDRFQAFVAQVADCAVSDRITSVESLKSSVCSDQELGTVEDMRQQLVVKLGENIRVHRLVHLKSESGCVVDYCHGVRIGVLVALSKNLPEFARDLAMHIAAMRPLAILPADVSADIIDKERGAFLAQANESGKPQEIIEKMVQGKLKKYLAGVALVEQAFVKDPDMKIKQLLQNADAVVEQFARLDLGDS